MASVTRRIAMISQPKGGYINPKTFEVTVLNDGAVLSDDENFNAGLIGSAVDYLTRFMNGNPGEKAFEISLLGAEKCESLCLKKNASKDALGKISKIKGLDDDSITCACQLSGYDVCLRAGPFGYKPVEDIHPSKNTIENIRVMVNRSIIFLKEYGPLISDGFTFEGGYTDTVDSGDGDYLTADTLWDFKVSIKNPTSKHTLQMLMYYIMGMHSKHKEFKSIRKLGIYNPRLNKIYEIEISKIDKSIIEEVEDDVIVY
jgi:hypothetical protein